MDTIATVIDIGQIADLTSQVATTGAFNLAGMVSDQIFEFTVGIVVVVQAAAN